MKKTYIQPEALVVELGFAHSVMLSVSGEDGSLVEDGGDGDGTDIGTKKFSGDFLWGGEW